MSFDKKITVHHVRSIFRFFLLHHINFAPLEPGVVGLVALLVLVGVAELELGCLVVLVGHP